MSTHEHGLPAHVQKILYGLCFIFCFQIASAQTSMSLKIKYSDTLVVGKYEPEVNDFKYKEIEIDPGDYRIKNTAIPRILNDETITMVDLVYSDYPQGDDFSDLNRKRIIELFMECPNAFNHLTIRWRLVKQIGVTSGYELKKYFHGFVIYFRPLIPFQAEKDYFNNILDGKKPLEDSTLIKVLNRNTSWKEMLCVADVTGSMSPYTVQLLLWAKMNEKLRTFKQFVFFNDNDVVSHNQSNMLDTSGIWDITTFKADKLIDKILWSMEKGSHIENDLEAIFYAAKKYPDNIKNIVLIADNWEDPCDMYLLSQLQELKIPIRVVICGVNSVLNTKYLEIAYATNGSVHTMEEDLMEMGKLTDGKVFKISGLSFKLSNGKFIPML
jgi:hypothetical protein